LDLKATLLKHGERYAGESNVETGAVALSTARMRDALDQLESNQRTEWDVLNLYDARGAKRTVSSVIH
jgi:hypothetical protein